MTERICIVGLEEAEYTQIKQHIDIPVIACEYLPKIVVKDGQLFVQPPNRVAFVPVTKMVFHGIYEDDFDFITGLAIWNGLCLPNAHAMMDCRLKLPCLARALKYTRFGSSPRGYVPAGMTFETEQDSVAKWGNWHCGENKARFSGSWKNEEASIIEPFLVGQAVRLVIIGDNYWQIKLEGSTWLKSIHDAAADFMDVDPELLADTEHVRRMVGLEIIANDYIVADDGSKHLLEVNHIPNVTRFPELWEAYRDFVVQWINVSPQ
jgi:hypothetical protein